VCRRKNGGAPWIVKYAFDANGQKGEGTFSTTEETARNLNKVGPSIDTVYPPFK
jgi:hypothetical protein